MKKTAVDWLKIKIDLIEFQDPAAEELYLEIQPLIDQAKEMEKEQMKALYTMHIVDTRTMELYDFEQYYNETFKSE